MARVYASVDELKAQPGINGDDQDMVLDLLLMAASQAIDGFCNRLKDGFKSEAIATAREFPGTGQAYVEIDECTEVSLVEVRSSFGGSYEVLSPASWLPAAGSYDHPKYGQTPYTLLLRTDPGGIFVKHSTGSSLNEFAPAPAQLSLPMVRVTARWGYSDTPPEAVKVATIIQAARWFKRGQSFWADAMASDGMQQLLYRKALDPDVQMILQYGRLVRTVYG